MTGAAQKLAAKLLPPNKLNELEMQLTIQAAFDELLAPHLTEQEARNALINEIQDKANAYAAAATALRAEQESEILRLRDELASAKAVLDGSMSAEPVAEA